MVFVTSFWSVRWLLVTRFTVTRTTMHTTLLCECVCVREKWGRGVRGCRAGGRRSNIQKLKNQNLSWTAFWIYDQMAQAHTVAHTHRHTHSLTHTQLQLHSGINSLGYAWELPQRAWAAIGCVTEWELCGQQTNTHQHTQTGTHTDRHIHRHTWSTTHAHIMSWE